MKKEILLPAAAWLGGIGGFALRRWELAEAYDPQLRLMQTVPATWLLWVLSGVLLALFAFGCRGMRKDLTAKQWFYAPVTGYVMLMVISGFVLMASGFAGLWQQRVLLEKDTMFLLTGILCLLGGMCVLMAGRSVYRGQWDKNAPLLFMGPSFATLVWLIAAYQRCARQPETSLYIWQMLSGVAVVLAVYGMVTLAVGKGGAGRACLFSLMAISLTLTTLADGFDLPFVLMYLFGLIYLTAQSWMLLCVASGRMPQGAGDQEKTEE